ncbi:MAG: diguanylate cyclase [Novosphingobium sp.]|nr:diguanylate cyclase [Novosphingobium sp.]
MDLISGSRQAQAIGIIDKVIAAYETAYRGKAVLCARDMADAANISLSAMLHKGGKVTIIGPGWCEALFLKGYALVDLNRSIEAEAALARAVAMAPTRAHYLNEYAELWKGRREWHRSYGLFARAYAISDQDPKSPDARITARSLRGMGYTKIELGDLDEAERMFHLSQQFDPDNAGVRTELEYIARKKATGTPGS